MVERVPCTTRPSMTVCAVCAGEQLTEGWRPILRLLEIVPRLGGEAQGVGLDSGAEAVGLAFQSVQLVASDHMGVLPLDLVAHALRIAALYGAQQVSSTSLNV